MAHASSFLTVISHTVQYIATIYVRIFWHMQTPILRIYFIWPTSAGGGKVISYEPLFRTMEKKGITAYKLFKMGFSKSTYYAMKSGKSVLASTIDQLCTLLECEVSDVVKFVPEQK